MKYKLGDLVRDYIDNSISRDGLEYQIKIAELKDEPIDDLVKEKELYSKKVDVVDRLFKEEYFTDDISIAPIEKWLSILQYIPIKSMYLLNTWNENKYELAKLVNTKISVLATSRCGGMKKLDGIEIDI